MKHRRSPDHPAPSVANSDQSSRLGRASAIMAAGTAASRVLGLVRNALLVAAIGTTGIAADAFDIANRIPNFAFAIISGGVLNAVLVPQILKAFASSNSKERLDKLLTISSASILGITALLTSGATLVVTLYSGDNWTPEQTSLAVSFALWCVPQLFFYGLYTLLGQVLNAKKMFGPFMWAPTMNNIVSIVGFGAFIVIYGSATTGHADVISSWDTLKIGILAGTATLGVASQALILFVPLWRSGFRWSLRWGMRGIGLRSAGKVALWTLGTAILDQIGVAVTTNFSSAAPMAALQESFGQYEQSASTASMVSGIAASAPDVFAIAGNAAYTQALMIYLLPHSLVTVSIATALFTGISQAAQEGRQDRIRIDLSRGLRTIGVFTVFATFALIVLSVPLTKAVVPTLSDSGNIAVAQVLSAMSLGLVPLGAMVLMKWVYFAFEDGATVFRMQVPSTIVLIAVSWIFTLMTPAAYWVVGIGIAMSLANVVAVLGRTVGLRKLLGGLDGKRILGLHLKVLCAAAIAAAVGWIVTLLFGRGPASFTTSLVITTVAGGIMLVVYVGTLTLLRVQELTDLAGPILRRIRHR